MKFRFYNNTALKFIGKQPPKQRQRIMEAIQKIPEGDIKALKSLDSYLRLRVGDYRIIFVVEDDTVIIRDVGNRGDVYKG